MSATLNNAEAVNRQQLDRYIQIFLTRHAAYLRYHRDELKHDVISRMLADYLFMGSRTHFEAGLQGILTNQERQLLSANPTFTSAWQIFVDLCWLKRKFSRLSVLLGIIVGLFVLGALLLWAAPYVIGPQSR